MFGVLFVSFNSRTLGRVRQSAIGLPASLSRFQFTHPGKGATKLQDLIAYYYKFQFTHPGKGATSEFGRTITALEKFQFTHPGKGATFGYAVSEGTLWVSIHAPWEGCDTKRAPPPAMPKKFQFTHPGKGATEIAPTGRLSWRGFNSRTLGRVRHPNGSKLYMNTLFQFTHPGKGATRDMGYKYPTIQFQFTHPGKGATLCSLLPSWFVHVSIHAPWEGCDNL